MKVVQTLEETKWHHFVQNHPKSNIFHSPEMFQVFSQTKNFHPTLWAVTSNNGDVLALLLPVQITMFGRFSNCLSTRAVVYGSVLCAPGVEGEQALDKLLQTYIRSIRGKVLFTELRNLSDMSDLQSTLRANEFNYEGHLNYLIKLDRSLDNIMQSIGRRTRRKIRQGLRRRKVTIEEVSHPEQLLECYELIIKSYNRARVPVADRSLFEAAFKILYKKGMVKFLLARVDDVCVASSVELIYKDMIYGWYSGINLKYSRYNPNELLMWYVLSFGMKNGYHIYDFGGAGKPDEEYGVRNFKAKFGGELVCFGRNTFIHYPNLFQFSKFGFRLYCRLSLFKYFK